MAAKRRDLGSLSPRMLEIQAKTNTVEPYRIAENLEIRQTRARRDDLHESWTEVEIGKRKLAELNRQAAALPEPVAPAEDADDETAAEYIGALGTWQAQRDHINTVAEGVVKSMNAAAIRYEQAFWGGHYDEVMELSADWEAEFFDAVRADVNDHFMAGVNTPPDGTDEAGEIVDVAEAVEAGKLPT